MKNTFKKVATSTVLAGILIAGGAAPSQAAGQLNQSSVETIQTASFNGMIQASSKKQRQTTTALNVRTNAGTKYKRITTIKKGAKVTVLRTKSGWSQIQSGKTKGWVSSKYLTNVKKSSSKKTATASTKSSSKTRYAKQATTIRTSTSTKAKRVATMKKGMKGTVLRTKGSWSQVKAGKSTGWVATRDLVTKKPSTSSKKTTTASSKKKTTLTRYATTNVNIRSNAGTKYKKIGTLKKSAKVTVTRSKSGWSQIKSGKTTGWVSSKYLSSKKPAAPKKAAAKKKATPKKSTAKKITLRQVNSYSKAQQYLKETCPKVKITKIKGSHSMYNPNNNTIMIASAHQNSSRLGWVFAHELMHHYQWHGKYKNDVNAWNNGIKGKKPVEIEADKMTYHMYGKTGQGYYSKSPATGKQLTNIKSIINKGKKAGC